MAILVWTILGFICGSIPFSVIVGRLAQQVDIRQYGDHNPGATNVLRAIGWRWGLLALLLDYLKGALPVGLAWFVFNFNGWQIIPIALAPLIGHAFSPWLGFKGGKAVASTFGIWTGLTIGVGPTLLGLLLGVMFAVFTISGWAVILAVLSFGCFVWIYYGEAFPEFVWIWIGNLALLIWTHRFDLAYRPGIRPALLHMIRRSR